MDYKHFNERREKEKRISCHFPPKKVEKVLTGYPAYYAGMKVHDFLISVNGQEVFEMNHAQLVKLIKGAGGSMKVDVERYVLFVSGFGTLMQKLSRNLSC